MNLKVISRNVGYALLVSALFMFLSILVSISRGNDSALAALSISFVITFTVGVFPFIFVRKTPAISLKEGYLIIVLSWLLSFVFGMLPYVLWGGPFTVINAWFESVSGFTTSGASILENIEALPDSLLFWRSSTHFIGGLGVVVFFLLIIPSSSPVRLRLIHMELSSLSKGEYRSRANRTVNIFAAVYLALAAAAFLCYWLAGMSPFDAVNHAFSVCATGGFSTRNLSIGAYHSTAINLITMVFMFLGSIHFGLIFLVFATRSLRPLNNPVLRFYVCVLAILSFITVLTLKFSGVSATWGEALMNGPFQILCYASTTGFAITDNSTWPALAAFAMMAGGIFCGCAGSTSGGLKADRGLVLLKAFSRQVRQTLHPSSFSEISLGKRILRSEEAYPLILYVALYFMTILLSVGLCIMAGSDAHDALVGSISSMGNVGPATGANLGTYGNFNSQPVLSKLIFSLDMFLGRIEVYPVLAVAAMMFRRRGNS